MRSGRDLNLNWCALTLLILAVLTARGVAQDPLRYITTDLGSFDGSVCSATDINEFGEVSIKVVLPNKLTRMFFWSADIFEELPCPLNNSEANAISDRGWIVGDGGGAGFLWSGNDCRDLQTRGSDSTANDIVHDGDHTYIVGQAKVNDVYEPVVWYDFNQVDTLRGVAQGYMTAINRSLQTVGCDTELGLAFTTNSDGVLYLNPLPDWQYSSAMDINDRGVVIGYSHNSSGLIHIATRWVEGVAEQLPLTIGYYSDAFAINSLGQIVGCEDYNMLCRYPLLWSDYKVYNVNDLIYSGDLVEAGGCEGINDAGQMVGWGYKDEFKDEIHAMLMTPLGLEITKPRPGNAGQVNTFDVVYADPGSLVELAYSMQPGYQYLPDCSGIGICLKNPSWIAQEQADENGKAQFSVFVNEGARGRSVYFQAADQEGCQISNRILHVFQ